MVKADIYQVTALLLSSHTPTDTNTHPHYTRIGGGRKLIIESEIAGEDGRGENGSSEYFTWKYGTSNPGGIKRSRAVFSSAFPLNLYSET